MLALWPQDLSTRTHCAPYEQRSVLVTEEEDTALLTVLKIVLPSES